MLLKTLTLKLESDKKIIGKPQLLRGFFATKFNEYVLLHQHHLGEFIYSYPLVQYKILNNIPTVIGINEGAEVLKEIYDKYDSIKLGDEEYRIYQREIIIKEQEFGVSGKFHKYKFLTPWFALNQKNFQEYKELNNKDRKEKLRKIMIGNIIAVSKGLSYVVDREIKLDAELVEVRSPFKGQEITTFNGEFIVNFNIPDLLGIGKSVSRGFGTIKKC
ncbi:hypothetical protein BEH94_09685 [Candidatus Altiarchaeales archaeon WOR_SM1_SCG]|nr:hypothetical protein BEH94_09685 [Candidatus Altiarchaeales archaeon WOR_SM1_SCG]